MGGETPVSVFGLGDSILEGIADVHSNAPVTPWTAHLVEAFDAHGLPTRYANAARRSARLADGLHRQLPEALAFGPTLAAVWLGLNDVLPRAFEPDVVRSAFRAIVAELTDSGARILTATMPRPEGSLPIPGWPLRRISDRVETLNEIVEQAAGDFGTLHLDFGAVVASAGRDVALGVDGIHPSPIGHWLVADTYLRLIRAEGGPAVAPTTPPADVPVTALRHLGWLATRGAPWAVRRGVSRLGS